MQSVPFLDGNIAGHMRDAELTEPLDRQWRGQSGEEKVPPRKVGEDVGWELLGGFPLEGVAVEVLVDELAARALQLVMRRVKVRRREAVEPSGLRKGHRGGGSGHGLA